MPSPDDIHDGYDPKMQAVKMADVFGIEKVWRRLYNTCNQYGDFTFKRSTSTIRCHLTERYVNEAWRCLSDDGGKTTITQSFAPALFLERWGVCMSVRNAKVYRYAITTQLDELFWYCHVQIPYIQLDTYPKNESKISLRCFDFESDFEVTFFKNKYKSHFQTVESYYKI